jgi:hypothetical protein
MMMRLAAIAVMLAALACTAAHAENPDIASRRVSQRTDFTDAEIRDGFFKIAFNAELQLGTPAERARKFDEPVRIFLDSKGEPDRRPDRTCRWAADVANGPAPTPGVGLLSIRGVGLFRSVQSPLPPKEGILIEAIGHEPRFVPVKVLLADEREVLSGRHAETRAESPDKLGCAAKAAAPGDVRQRALVLTVCQQQSHGLIEPARQQHGANAALVGQEPVK